MKPTDIAAYIGAAAWLPQIISWIYKAYVTPQITISPDKFLEIGFTSYGPIFNIRLALSADRKSAIIDSFVVELTHEDGDSRILRWSGMNETFSEVTDSMGNRQVISKDQPAIALKIGTESLLEKFVRFQEPRFFDRIRSHLDEVTNHFDFLKKTNDDYVNEILKSKQFHDLSETRKKAFWWRPGKYKATFKIGSPKKINLTHGTFSFTLTTIDIDKLKKNLETLDIELKNVINSNLPDHTPLPVNWNWANVEFNKYK
ncbi:hypothetical protein [Desulfocicer niacini]